jgi:hypothetical protein
MALEGTVTTPFGQVSKKTAVIAGGFVLALAGIVWYRQRQANAKAASVAAAGGSTIDPATGYPYGSAEDAAALATQAGYVSAVGGGGGGGGSSIPTPNSGPGTFTSNAQWAQYVQQYLVGNGSVTDSGKLSTAIGKYLAGLALSSDEIDLVHMAVAIGDKPPVAGSTGFPPSINTAPAPEPKYFDIGHDGEHVDTFLSAHPEFNLTLEKLQALNPGHILRASNKGYDPNGDFWVINATRVRIE